MLPFILISIPSFCLRELAVLFTSQVEGLTFPGVRPCCRAPVAYIQYIYKKSKKSTNIKAVKFIHSEFLLPLYLQGLIFSVLLWSWPLSLIMAWCDVSLNADEPGRIELSVRYDQWGLLCRVLCCILSAVCTHTHTFMSKSSLLANMRILLAVAVLQLLPLPSLLVSRMYSSVQQNIRHFVLFLSGAGD